MKKFSKLVLLLLATIAALQGCQTSKHYNEWVEKNGANYYYNENGEMLKNTISTIDGKEYYFNDDGVKTCGPVEKDGKKYFFTEDGKLLKNDWGYYNNYYYRTDENGELVIGWFQDPSDKEWYYLS